MARFKNHLLVVVGCAVAGMIVAALSTGTAQAVVSTLVSVVNATTSPVPTSVVNPGTSPVLGSSVDEPGRIAYQSTVSMSGQCTVGNACGFQFPVVPSGHRVVIQHISGAVTLTPVSTGAAPTTIYVQILGPTNNNLAAFFAPIGVSNSSALFEPFDEPILLYVDGSTAVSVTVVINGGTGGFEGGSSPQFVTFMGYELNCTQVACAPIATQ